VFISKKQSYLLLTLLLITRWTIAQSPAVAGFNFGFLPPSKPQDIATAAEFSFQEYSAFIKIPCKFRNSKTVVNNALDYSFLNSSVYGLATHHSEAYSVEFHRWRYNLQLLHVFEKKWRLVVSLRPTLSSDFKSQLSGDDFMLQGFALSSKKVNEVFSVGGGLAYNTRFGKPSLLPTMLVSLKRGRHQISLLLPMQSSYQFTIGQKNKLMIGLKHTFNGGQFNITASSPKNRDNSEADKVSYSRMNLGATLNYNLTKLMEFEIFGGVSLRRKYTFLDTYEKLYEFNLKNTPFVQASINLVPARRR